MTNDKNPTPEQKALAEEIVLNEPMLQYFAFHHLPPHLQAISSIFMDAAKFLVLELARCPERTVALRKLLEAKDAAVRTRVFHGPAKPE